MLQNSLKFLISFSVVVRALNYQKIQGPKQSNFSHLRDFTCDVVKDELQKHPEMQTVALLELQNGFPKEFSREILECMPENVAKIIIKHHTDASAIWKKRTLPKESLIIYIVDEVKEYQSFYQHFYSFKRNFPVIHHLSKRLIVSSWPPKKNYYFNNNLCIKFLNCILIWALNDKVVAKILYRYDISNYEQRFGVFNSSRHENLSQLFFPDKTINLNKLPLSIGYQDHYDAHYYGGDSPNSKWSYYFEILEHKINANLSFLRFYKNEFLTLNFETKKRNLVVTLIEEGNLDFYMNMDSTGGDGKYELESYSNIDYCFLVPLPKAYSITELILFLPLDESCWMWLGITVALSTLIWRISEGHWNFCFGAFAYFVGQSSLCWEIRTSRLVLKILLQILIFTFFIFSNGYQSIVTSFMLNSVEEKRLKTLDELFGSSMKFEPHPRLESLYNENINYQKAKRNDRIKSFNLSQNQDFLQQMVDKNLAWPQPCKSWQEQIENEGDGTSWEGIYQIPEVAYVEARDLYIKPFHPYLDKFQEIMDRSLETGLHVAWERFYREVERKYYPKTKKEEPEEEILNFDEIIPFFLILAIGSSAALLALFCEIFIHDFVSEITKEYLRRKFNEIFPKSKRRKNKNKKSRNNNKKNMKRIQVRPKPIHGGRKSI